MKPLTLETSMVINKYDARGDVEYEEEVIVTGVYYPEDDDLEIEECVDSHDRDVELNEREHERAMERLWAVVCDLDEEEDPDGCGGSAVDYRNLVEDFE